MVRVDVGTEDGRVRFARADAPARSLRAPLVLGPVARVAYVIPVQPWSLRSLLANPMYLIMGLMAVMMFIMPKMMESIDPDVRGRAHCSHVAASHARCAQELKQMQEQMGKGGTLGLLQVRVCRCRRMTAFGCRRCVLTRLLALQGALMGEPPAPAPKKKAIEGGAGGSSGGGNKKKH